MIKICLNAGHGINTAGKRCLKSLDPNETREWILNNRIVSKIENLLSNYDGYELLRVDDRTGKTDIALKTRTDKANAFEADIYISIHHNAGINGGSGGGIVAYTYTDVSEATKQWQTDLYNSLIKHTGLKGNRATPKATANFWECKKTKMPAVLLECGFMDSKTDVPIILSASYADKCAAAITEVIVSRCKLVKKPDQEADQKTIYRVQVGAYSDPVEAEAVKNAFVKIGIKASVIDG